MLDFWEYIAEREAIRHRRFDLEEDYPWTDDEILTEMHCNNVFREDNARSQLITDMLDTCDTDEERLWNVLLFRRLLQTSRSWKAFLGRKATPDDLPELVERIEDSDEVVWSETQQIYPMMDFEGETVLDRTIECLYNDWYLAPELVEGLHEQETAQGAWRLLHDDPRMPGMGVYIGWQVILDLRYGWNPLVHEWGGDWAPQTIPVQKATAAHVDFPHVRDVYDDKVWPLTPLEALDAMRHVVDTQEDELERRGLLEQWEASSGGRRLTVPDVEWTFCGIGRYWKVACGRQEIRKHFHPPGWGEGLE